MERISGSQLRRAQSSLELPFQGEIVALQEPLPDRRYGYDPESSASTA